MKLEGVSVVLPILLVRVMLKRPACGLFGSTGLVLGVIVPGMELGEVLRFVRVT